MAKIGIRIWILIVVLFFAVIAISPSLDEGVVISSVNQNSTAFSEGLRQGMVIANVNGNPINKISDYSSAIGSIFGENNATKKVTFSTDQGEYIMFTDKVPEISVGILPKTNIKTGLDLSGGARALLQPVNVTLNSDQTDDLISVMEERLNVYGIKDVNIRQVKDLEGKSFVKVEIAGATPEDIDSLLAKQGKFTALIGGETVFEGGDKDVSDVCRNDATCAGVTSCTPGQLGGSSCNFQFTIYLTEKAAQRHADITEKLALDETGQYLNESLSLNIDGTEVDSLLISSGLRGQFTTQISIQGSGVGNTQDEAYDDATASMNQLQTVLITGSLPYKLEIVKLDTVSPLLGQEFAGALVKLALVVFAIISVILFIRYRKIKVTLAVILTMVSEAIITLGFAALVQWNLDAPAIAGIIAGMGTGINDQIVIIEESVSNKNVSIKERIKRALFIIIGAFLTIFAAMVPLLWAGAGMLRGFAFTTLVGVTVGILITRPAFADIIKRIEDK